jgi:hypothetical protein
VKEERRKKERVEIIMRRVLWTAGGCQYRRSTDGAEDHISMRDDENRDMSHGLPVPEEGLRDDCAGLAFAMS